MRPCRATRAGTQAPPLPTSSYFSTQSHANKITIYAQPTPTAPTVPRVIHPNEINRPRAIPQTTLTIHTQSAQTTSTVPRAIYPNEIVGAVPVCPPERPRSGVSIPKIHALYAGNLTADAPLQGDTGGHTGSAPTHFIIFFHTIPCKQNNHLCATHPNGANRPTRNPPKRNQPPTRNPSNDINHPHAICPNDINRSTRNLPKRNRRGGACVPARTSA